MVNFPSNKGEPFRPEANSLLFHTRVKLTMYKTSNPVSTAILAETPSCTPGPTINPFGSSIIRLRLVAADGGELVEEADDDMIMIYYEKK